MIDPLTPEAIKDIRHHYGLSQQAFARILGIGEASIARYENGAKPTKANANLIRAAAIPQFMADCLEREGEALSPKQRESVERIVYAEVTFDEGGNTMDINEIYELTLQQEVLNEKAAELLGDIMRGLMEAEATHDEGLKLVYEDMFAQISLLKPEITTNEALDHTALSRMEGELRCMRSLVNRTMKRAA
ncbi:MAG: helix-turn-helix domain-containing protein [Adlercreutzia sp.]|nr:helix-turn-helix domain-containing protein [Adlercreutzia sp.]